MDLSEPSNETHLLVAGRIAIPLAEFDWRAARSSGPGGQNVNKVNSRMTLVWSLSRSAALPSEVRARLVQRYAKRINQEGELQITSDEYRDQPRNRQACLDRLADMLTSVAVLPKARRATRPSQGSVRRRLADKNQRSQTKQSRQRPSDE